MAAYLAVIGLFAAPIAIKAFAEMVYSNQPWTLALRDVLFVSPFAAVLSLPLTGVLDGAAVGMNWSALDAPLFLLFYLVADHLMIGSMIALFTRRWRVAE